MNTHPKISEAHQLLASGKCQEAMGIFKSLIDCGIDVPNAKLGFGVSLMKDGKYEEAVKFYSECGLDCPEVCINKATCYDHIGDVKREIETLRRLLLFPRNRNMEGLYRKLAMMAMKNNDIGSAYHALMAVFELDPEDYSVCMALADHCRKMGMHKQGVTYYLKALDLTNDLKSKGHIYGLIGGLYKDSGQQDQMLYYMKKCYDIIKNENSASNLIMGMQYAHGISFKQFYDQCNEFSLRFLRHLPRHQFPISRLDPAKAKSGLRIGFSSGDFALHSLSNLLLEPFKRFKEVAPQHRLFIYHAREASRDDGISEAYKSSVDVWRCIHGMSDKDAAGLVYKDDIDVLVEIAGHTAYNRLPMFGHKPAPVQVGWVSGMMSPPAIETINYFLTDQWIRPPCADTVCFEKMYNLPAAYCYFPLAKAPDINPKLPMDSNRYVSLGSINNPCKLSNEVIDTWGECMKRLPGSKLHVKVYNSSTDKNIRSRLGNMGISPDRVVPVSNLPKGEDVMAYYTNNIDIALDTWPCAGCLTSAEAMWMGCPVVTYYGDTFLHRQTWTILNQIGLPELGAPTTTGFIQAVVDLATDHNKLRNIRNNLRQYMDKAPIRDPVGMAKGVMTSLESAWVDWCESRIRLQEGLA
jgi:predicted O-linked N-acetylglucosamine transferase (SPINDLY family)